LLVSSRLFPISETGGGTITIVGVISLCLPPSFPHSNPYLYFGFSWILIQPIWLEIEEDMKDMEGMSIVRITRK
jgi:hypothetical protein